MYRQLSPDKISAKIGLLEQRIGERFPGAGLGGVCGELRTVSGETERACEAIVRPNWPLRGAVGFAIGVIVFGLVESVITLGIPERRFPLAEFVQILEATLSAGVLIVAAITFLVTVETRIKRARSLAALNELRALAHVIDMHQLAKDTSRVVVPGTPTPSSPRLQMTPFQLVRYLEYCSEMQSLVGKIAALYAQNFRDRVVLAAVNELESLTTGISRKIWQKIMLLRNHDVAGARAPAAGAIEIIEG